MNLVKGLLAKLRQAGVTGSLHTLLESYLSDRIARTRVEGECSSDSDIKAGVPQGSRLGPILFILCISDLVHVLNCMPHIFADDTTLLAVGNNTHETVEMLNHDLQSISRWAKHWKVKFNGDKHVKHIKHATQGHHIFRKKNPNTPNTPNTLNTDIKCFGKISNTSNTSNTLNTCHFV